MPLATIQWLALLGFILSVYFIYVKKKHASTKNYKALCDFTQTISCSKAAESKYGSIAIIPNAYYGIIFYILVFILVFSLNQLVFYLGILASLFSLFLIFASFKIKIFCPLCVSTYIINFLILYLSYAAL